jgi:hypothetical protein
MSRVYDLDDRELIPCSPDRLFNILLDVRSYYRWWPKEVKFDLRGDEPMARVGSVIVMQPPFMKVWMRVLQLDRPTIMILDVFKGDYVGSARWMLAPMAQSTELAYVTTVRFTSLKMKLATLFVDVAAKHSQAMRQAFEGLKRYVR